MQFLTKFEIFLNKSLLPGIFISSKNSSKLSDEVVLEILILLMNENIVFFNFGGISFSNKHETRYPFFPNSFINFSTLSEINKTILSTK